MISKEHRFHGRASLRFVYQKGKIVRGDFFSLRYSHNPRRQSYRLAVVVSRKVQKSAVVRNRIRRRLYEAVRILEDQISGPYDIVMTVFRAELADLEPTELQIRVKNQLAAAGITAKR